MKYWILLIICGFYSCNKDAAIIEQCPIYYEIDSTQQYNIYRKWKFIGFQTNNSDAIEYPPCEGYDFYSHNNKFEITVSFVDTPHNYNDTLMYTYPYLFSGSAPINGYSGTFKINSDALTIGPVAITLMEGRKSLWIMKTNIFQPYKMLLNLK